MQYDISELQLFFADDPGALAEIIRQFAKDMLLICDRLTGCLYVLDFDSELSELHKLKGPVNYLKILPAAGIVEQMEEMARQRDAGETHFLLLRKLKEILSATSAELSAQYQLQ